MSQQAAANGAQGLLDARQSLFSSLYGTAAPSPTVLGVQVNGADSANAEAVDTGEAALQQSQSSLLSTLSTTSGWLPTSVFQLNLLQSLTRSGLLGYHAASPTASEALAAGQAAQANDAQLLGDVASGSGDETPLNPLSAYLSGIYNQTSRFSLAPAGSNVGGSLSFSI